MADIARAKKEIEKAKTLLVSRSGTLSDAVGHLTRAVEYLVPDEAEETESAQEPRSEPIAVNPQPSADAVAGGAPQTDWVQTVHEAKSEAPKSRRSGRRPKKQ